MAQRAMCDDCGRPQTVCLCHAFTTLHPSLQLIIWQDPAEARHPLSTAPLLHKSIAGSRLIRGDVFSRQDIFAGTAEHHCAVVFPFAHKAALTAGRYADITHLLILDGTWRKVRKLLLANPWLKDLNHLALDVQHGSRYAIRTSPRDDGLSTIEAGAQALSLLDNEHDYSAILTVLDEMVRIQKGFGHKA